MPWEHGKRAKGGDLFERGLFRESRYVFSSDEEQQVSRFSNYFVFQTVRRLRRRLSANAVLRNRILFFLLSTSLFGYMIYHWVV